jgi:hypothetical protein
MGHGKRGKKTSAGCDDSETWCGKIVKAGRTTTAKITKIA